MITDMRASIEFELEEAEEYKKRFRAPRMVSVATGYAAFNHIRAVCESIRGAFEGLDIQVYPIRNDFFGHSITVAGLLTGQDIAAQLQGKELGDELIFPSVCLRAEGDVFLDHMTPEELSEKLGVPTRPSSGEGREFLSAVLGIN